MNHSVKLIAVTQPENESINAEELISYCARVSNPTNQENTKTSSKLLQYCIKNSHWSIFEMVDLVIEIQCTRAIGRQILRHRSFSFQEFSQRYAEVDETMFVQNWIEARTQDAKNRQNSFETDDYDVIHDWTTIQKETIKHAIENYHHMIELGLAKEQARAILPEGLTMSKLYMKGSLRSWITYIALREKNGTQKEHQDIAKDCKKIILSKFPSLKDHLGENDWII